MNVDLKICGITNLTSIKIAARNNIKNLGFVSNNLLGPNTCNDTKIKELIKECDYYKISSVLLTKHQNLQELIQQLDFTKPGTVSCSYFFNKEDFASLKSIFPKLRVGIAINPVKFDESYLNSVKSIMDILYYDLNVYTQSNITTHSIEDNIKQISFLKNINLPIYIGGGIDNNNAKIIIDRISPSGIDISRGLKDENNNISLVKLNELRTNLSVV
jgi:phosphoribosylanthranilate isomerase